MTGYFTPIGSQALGGYGYPFADSAFPQEMQ